MYRIILAVALMAGITGAERAHATQFRFAFSGQISDQYAVDRQFQTIPVPSNPVRIGDTVSGSILFETRRSSSDFDGNGFSFYFPGGLDFRLTVGSALSYASVAQQEVFTKLVLSNDNGGSGGSADSLEIASLLYGTVPFGGFSGNSAIVFQYNVYDFLGQALSSQRIEDLQPLTVFSNMGSAFVSFNDNGQFGSGQIVNMSVTKLQASLTQLDAVPEPASWTLLLLGFGGIGHSVRSRTRISARLRLA